MIFNKTITNYGIKKHRGFFTVERKYVHHIFNFPYRVEWKPVTELRNSKLHGLAMQLPKHFATDKTARDFIKREIEKTQNKASF